MSISPELHASVKSWVSRRLLPELNAPGAVFTLQPAAQGVHSRVFYLTVDGRPPMVLKAVDKRGRFRDLLLCSRHLHQHTVPTPEIITAHEDRALILRRGYHVLVEQRLEGTTLKEHGDWTALIPAVGAFFARMHTVQRSTWGKINRGSSGNFFDYIRDRLTEKLAQWQRYDTARALQDAIPPWVRPWQRRVSDLNTFSLSHCDPNPGNLFATDDGRIFLLDIGNMRYLPRAIDYFTLRIHLCESDREKMSLLDTAYHSAMPAEEHEQFTVCADFFNLYVLVNFAAMLARSRATADVADPYYEAYAHYLQLAHAMIKDLLQQPQP